MRWPFRRRRTELAAHADEPVAAQEVPVRRAGRQWATLPPLPVTVRPSAPLVIGPAPVLAPLPGRRPVVGPHIAAATGRVEGLARAVPLDPVPPGAPASPMVEVPVHTEVAARPPMVHRTVRSGPPSRPAPLTEAVDSYVGEPREPAEPYRAPAWLRYTPTWLQQGLPPIDAGLGLDLPEPAPEPPRTAPVPVRPVLPPSRVTESPESSSTVDDPPPPPPRRRSRRRPNLGQTRKLGLGPPIKQAPEQELVLPPAPEPVPVAPDPEPGPVAAAPVPPADEASGEEEPPAPQPPPQPPPMLHRPAPPVMTDRPDGSVSAAPPPVAPAEPHPPAAPSGRPPAGPAREPSPPPASGPVSAAAPVPRPVPTAVGLVYRATPGGAPQRPVARARTVSQVPSGVASAIRGRTGIDVTDVPVHRGPEVAAEARSFGARAFTRGGEVFLPEEAGSLDSPKARGLLAHELVHVVQQRTLGSSLPALSTSAGAALEAQAVAVEHEHSGEAPAPLVHPSLPRVISQAARTVGVQLAPLVSEPPMGFSSVPSTPEPAAPLATSLSEPVREEIGEISEASATRVFQQWTNPALGGSGFSFGGETAQTQQLPETADIFAPSSPSLPAPTAGGEVDSGAETEMASQLLLVVNMDRASKGEPPLGELDAATMEQIRRTIADQNAMAASRAMMLGTASAGAAANALATELETERSSSPATSDDGFEPAMPEPAPVPAPQQVSEEHSALRDGWLDLEKVDLDELSTRLYDRLRSRLRLELLIDRERAGLLSDFR